MNDWFRSWHGAPTDNKWLVIARKADTTPGMVSAVVWALFDYASQNRDRGSIVGFDVETYAAFSGWEEDAIAAVIAALKDKGVIGPDGGLHNWDKRQPKREDSSTDRVRAFREKQKQNEHNETDCNALKRTETLDKIREDTDTEGSVADATGTVVPIKPMTNRERLWIEGRPALLALGVPDKQAGSMMGRWLKDASDDHRRVLDAILRAREMAPTGPIAWITAHLKSEKCHAGKPQSVQDAASALRQWAAGGSPFDA
jgi:hypothetical protein